MGFRAPKTSFPNNTYSSNWDDTIIAACTTISREANSTGIFQASVGHLISLKNSTGRPIHFTRSNFTSST